MNIAAACVVVFTSLYTAQQIALDFETWKPVILINLCLISVGIAVPFLHRFGETVGVADIEALYYYAQVLEQAPTTLRDAADLYSTLLELSPQFRDARSRLERLRQGQSSPVTSIYEDAERDPSSLFFQVQEDVMAR